MFDCTGSGLYPLLLCCGTSFGVINVWLIGEPSDGSVDTKLLHVLQGHLYNPVTSLVIHPDGMLLASGDNQPFYAF